MLHFNFFFLHISNFVAKFVGKYKKNYRKLRCFRKEILFCGVI